MSDWVLAGIGTALSCFLVGFAVYLLALVPWFLGMALPLLAGTRVNNGDDGYAYPLTGRLVKRPLLLG